MKTNTHCLNCNQQLLGDYCHLCGQQKTDLTLTFSELVRDFLGDMFTYDSRFYRTILPLLFRPGFLSLEYFKGKRAPYVPPLRLYLFISFILFLWLALVDTNMINIGNNQPDLEVVDQRVLSEEFSQGLSEAGIAEVPGWVNDFRNRFSNNLKIIEQNPDSFLKLLSSRLPYLMFILLPVFALILWLHFCLSRLGYLRHFIFALHFHAFAYLMLLLLSLSSWIVDWDYGLIGLLLLNLYIAIAMRKNYGSSKVGCVLKTLSILTCYVTILSLGIGAFFFVNVLNYA